MTHYPQVQTNPMGNAVSISIHGQECFRLEQDRRTGGLWRLYPVLDGECGTPIDHDRYRADLLERIESVYMGCTAQYFVQLAKLQVLHFGALATEPTRRFFEAFVGWLQTNTATLPDKPALYV